MAAIKKKAKAKPSVASKVKRKAEEVPAASQRKPPKAKNYMEEQSEADAKTGLMSSIDSGFKKMKNLDEELRKTVALGLQTKDIDLQWELLHRIHEIMKDIQSIRSGTVRQAKVSGIEKLLRKKP